MWRSTPACMQARKSAVGERRQHVDGVRCHPKRQSPSETRGRRRKRARGNAALDSNPNVRCKALHNGACLQGSRAKLWPFDREPPAGLPLRAPTANSTGGSRRPRLVLSTSCATRAESGALFNIMATIQNMICELVACGWRAGGRRRVGGQDASPRSCAVGRLPCRTTLDHRSVHEYPRRS